MNRYTILIVDDDSLLQTALDNILSEQYQTSLPEAAKRRWRSLAITRWIWSCSIYACPAWMASRPCRRSKNNKRVCW